MLKSQALPSSKSVPLRLRLYPDLRWTRAEVTRGFALFWLQKTEEELNHILCIKILACEAVQSLSPVIF